jgi:predicted ribosomally synthesized peptide with SipW-like signal peptide
MKKILTSLSVILLVAGIVIGGTIAYFNDTETSTGNVFTAGSIDLTVDSFGATYNGEDVTDPDSTWTARDLTDQKFFVFDDIKPGDYGRRNISVHADDNLAWACLLVVNKEDGENGLTDPETEAGDITDNVGELSGNLEIFAWQDNDSDLVYEPGSPEFEDQLPINGSFDVDSFFDITYDIDITDSESGTPPLEPTGYAGTRNITIAWCAGNQTVNQQTGEITCDGSAMGDVSQTDTFTADVVLYAEQTRNNPNFKCTDVNLESQPPY